LQVLRHILNGGKIKSVASHGDRCNRNIPVIGIDGRTLGALGQFSDNVAHLVAKVLPGVGNAIWTDRVIEIGIDQHLTGRDDCLDILDFADFPDFPFYRDRDQIFDPSRRHAFEFGQHGSGADGDGRIFPFRYSDIGQEPHREQASHHQVCETGFLEPETRQEIHGFTLPAGRAAQAALPSCPRAKTTRRQLRHVPRD